MATPIDQLIPPDECDVPVYNELRDEFLSGTGLHDMVADLFADGTVDPTKYREALATWTVTADEYHEAMGTEPKTKPEITKSPTKLHCVGTTAGNVCGNGTFTLLDGEPYCKLHRGDTR